MPQWTQQRSVSKEQLTEPEKTKKGKGKRQEESKAELEETKSVPAEPREEVKVALKDQDAFKLVVGSEKFKQSQTLKVPEPEEEDDDYDSESDLGIDEATKEVIKLVNVHKTYLLGIEGVPALRGINVTIHEGEFITILGTSGGGKTTLLNIIGTIDKPSKGDVYICGLRIKHSTSDTLLAQIRLSKLGFVF